MINTEGPQKNLTFGDYAFLLTGLALCFVFWAFFFGVITSAVLIVLIMGYARFQIPIKIWLKEKTKDKNESQLLMLGYFFIIGFGFLISGIALIFKNTPISNKAAMISVYAFGILFINGIITVLMQSLKEIQIPKTSEEPLSHKEPPTTNISLDYKLPPKLRREDFPDDASYLLALAELNTDYEEESIVRGVSRGLARQQAKKLLESQQKSQQKNQPPPD